MKEIEYTDPSDLSCQESLMEWQREIMLETTDPKIRLADLENSNQELIEKSDPDIEVKL